MSEMAYLSLLLLTVLCASSLSGVSPLASSARGAVQAFCGKPVLSEGGEPPSLNARLGIDRRATHLGGKVRIRVENLGSQAVVYGYAYRLARFKNGSWVNQPTGPFFGARVFAQAGRAGPCQKVPIDDDALRGTYRIAKKVALAGSGQDKSMTIRTTFKVR
jgi:hypothetical protein